MAKSVLALGAHADDFAFGAGATMMMAAERGYDVHAVSLTRNISTGMGESLQGICGEYGMTFRCMDFESQALEITPESKRAVAAVVGEFAPEIVFLVWPRDLHHDHTVAGELGMIALRQGHRLYARPVLPPRKVFYCDMGPTHAVGFVPTVHVDVTAVWPRYMEFFRRACETLRHAGPEHKELLARYRALEADRGFEDTPEYVEAFAAADVWVQDVL